MRTPLQPLFHALDKLLQNGMQLQNVLQQEQQALVKREIEQLNEITRHKRNLLQTLAYEYNAFISQLAAQGYPAPQSISRFLQTLDPRAELLERWHAYASCIETCQALNRDNGAVISIGIKQTTQALNLLKTNLPEHNTARYSKSGVSQDASLSYGMNLKA